MAKITLLKRKCDCIGDCIKGGEKEISGKCIGCNHFATIKPDIKINIKD